MRTVTSRHWPNWSINNDPRHAPVNASKEANIPVLARYAKDGYAILCAVPSCTLMFKQEIPLMYPDDADVQLVKEHRWDPFEYLMGRKRDGLLKAEFGTPLGKIS